MSTVPPPKVRKATGQRLINATGEVVKEWTSPGGVKCCWWVKYSYWSVPILEFSDSLIFIDEAIAPSSESQQLSLF